MDFNTLLVYLPVADFTQPYPAIPYLAGYLRQQGEKVCIKDLNIDALEYILSPAFLEKCRQKVDERFTLLDNKNALNFMEQKEYLKCIEVSSLNPKTLNGENILANFKDTTTFFDFQAYQKNSSLLQQALTLISAAYFPTQIEPGGYTTPFFLSSRADIDAQTDKHINPFIEYYEQQFLPLVAAEKPDLIGISVTYHSQILQMFALANLLKKNFPSIHICAGGAFLSRMVLNMPRKKMKTLFDYLDSIIIYEGETALHKLILHLKMLKTTTAPSQPFSLPNVIYYDRPKYDILFPPGEAFVENLDELPPPDFTGFPLDKYVAPKVVLPYAPTRGCYWNKCAFCHYGATKEGTAQYRERSIEKIVADMEFLAAKYDVNHFALSIDVMSPVLALHLADEIIRKKLAFLWNTEIKIEKNFTRENCQKLKQGGCLSVAVGLESGCERILVLIEKGFTPPTAAAVIKNLADAGICVQVMSFLDFPTETTAEAMETIAFIGQNKAHIALFTLGNFELLPGSRVFKNPQAYDLTHIRYADGDEFKLSCLYKEKQQSKLDTDVYDIDEAYLQIAGEYAGLEFPFVGAVSTNHTFLYFERFGKDIFKNEDMLGNTEKEQPTKVLDELSKPRLNGDTKILAGNFSLREISESLAKNSHFLKESMKKSGQSYRQVFYKILNKERVFPTRSFYIMLNDMKWSELPGQVKEILDLCNGENVFKNIIESQGTSNKEVIETILNDLYGVDIVIV